jgi:membrane protease YdiL (CAAX protease family)
MKNKKWMQQSPARGNLIMMLMILLAIILSGFQSLFMEKHFIVQILFAQTSLLLIPLILYFWLTKQAPKKVIAMEAIPPKIIIWILVLTAACLPLYELMGQVLGIFFSTPIKDEVGGLVGVVPLWQLIVFGSLIPGIFEELFLRSVFYNEYHKHEKGVSVGKTALAVAAFTALMIGNVHMAVPAFLSSILFFYILHYTRNFTVSMISHLIMNAFMFIKFHVSGYMIFSENLMNGQFASWVILIGLALLMIPLILKYIKKFKIYHDEKFLTTLYPEKHPSDQISKILTWPFWITTGILALMMIGNEIAVHFSN